MCSWSVVLAKERRREREKEGGSLNPGPMSFPFHKIALWLILDLAESRVEDGIKKFYSSKW